jgi:hypothetical protein
MTSYPVWITTAGNLGIIQENEFYIKDLQVSDSTVGALEYFFIAGELPPGIQVTRAGTIQGVPVVQESTNTNRNYQFSIRVRNSAGLIADRTFSMTITNIQPPVIFQREYELGDFFDGTFFNFQLLTLNLARSENLVWTLENGQLPAGVTFTSGGLISGFILPLPVDGAAGLTGYNQTRFNQFGFDNVGLYRNNIYTFTVKVFDGANYDTFTYTMRVAARGNWSADNSLDLVVNDILTIDRDNRYVPIMTTVQQDLPEIRSDSNFAFKFNAIDPENDAIEFIEIAVAGSNFDISNYDINNYSQEALELPPGLVLDAESGWLYGYIPPQTEVSRTYSFGVSAFKRDDPSYISDTITYTVTVLGDIINSVTWITPADLGLLDNGSISELGVSAVNSIGKDMVYSLVSANSRLPQGLKLLPTGLIVGRASFRYFSLDSDSTTIDGGAGTFDNVYRFTVLAESVDDTIDKGLWATNTDYEIKDVVSYNGILYQCVTNHTSGVLGLTSDVDQAYWTLYFKVSAIRTFRVRINNYDQIPYENLYLQALPSLTQRQFFRNIINNTEIFPEELIYRPSDPWFGRADSVRSLFLAGLNPSYASAYIEAMADHHYNKTIQFGAVRTARALDENFKTKYEVVYLDLTDSMLNNGLGPEYVIDLTDKINAWLSDTGVSYSVVYPNSFTNMSSAVSGALGFQHQGSLPDWMTSTQDDGRVLGFTNAVVLAHTVPGASKLIAYRLNSQGLQFNNIDFVIDRYSLDNHLSEHFNIATNQFNLGTETTFGVIQSPFGVNLNATYAVRGVPFDNIHGKSVEFIRSIGGLDGATNFRDGDTLVFAQQEDFVALAGSSVEINQNQGWNRDGEVVPGYIENLLDPTVPNQRAGIWRIRLVNAVNQFQASDFDRQDVGFDTTAFDYEETVVVPPPQFIYSSDFGSVVPGFDGKVFDFQLVAQDQPVRPDQVVSLEFTGNYDQSPLWQPATSYSAGTVVLNSGSVFRCVQSHVSAVNFNTNLPLWEQLGMVKPNTYIQIGNGNLFGQRIVYYDPTLKPEKSVPEFSVYDANVTNFIDQTRFNNYTTRFFTLRDSYAEARINDKYLKFPKYGVFK